MKYAEVLEALDMVSPVVPGGSLKHSLSMPGRKLGLINPPRQPWFPKAPPLPRPQGQVIEGANVPELIKALDDVKPGGTILLADGRYMMPRYVEIKTDGVSLRGKSGRPSR